MITQFSMVEHGPFTDELLTAIIPQPLLSPLCRGTRIREARRPRNSLWASEKVKLPQERQFPKNMWDLARVASAKIHEGNPQLKRK